MCHKSTKARRASNRVIYFARFRPAALPPDPRRHTSVMGRSNTSHSERTHTCIQVQISRARSPSGPSRCRRGADDPGVPSHWAQRRAACQRRSSSAATCAQLPPQRRSSTLSSRCSTRPPTPITSSYQAGAPPIGGAMHVLDLPVPAMQTGGGGGTKTPIHDGQPKVIHRGSATSRCRPRRPRCS